MSEVIKCDVCGAPATSDPQLANPEDITVDTRRPWERHEQQEAT